VSSNLTAPTILTF